MSIQEFFEYVSTLVADEHPAIERILDVYITEKKDAAISKLEEKYTGNLYDAIGHESLFQESTINEANKNDNN
jgi:hypothetical protein